jgi:hypothetical protein
VLCCDTCPVYLLVSHVSFCLCCVIPICIVCLSPFPTSPHISVCRSPPDLQTHPQACSFSHALSFVFMCGPEAGGTSRFFLPLTRTRLALTHCASPERMQISGQHDKRLAHERTDAIHGCFTPVKCWYTRELQAWIVAKVRVIPRLCPVCVAPHTTIPAPSLCALLAVLVGRM